MSKCENCGHDLVNCGIHPHKDIVSFGNLVGCGHKLAKDEYCGCTHPELKGDKK